MTTKMDLTRRSFLKGLLGATAAVAVSNGITKQALAFIEDESLSVAERLRRALIAAYPKIDADRLGVGSYRVCIHWKDGQKTTGSWRSYDGEGPTGETEEQRATRIASAEEAAIAKFMAECKYQQEHDSNPEKIHVPAYRKRRDAARRRHW